MSEHRGRRGQEGDRCNSNGFEMRRAIIAPKIISTKAAGSGTDAATLDPRSLAPLTVLGPGVRAKIVKIACVDLIISVPVGSQSGSGLTKCFCAKQT